MPHIYANKFSVEKLCLAIRDKPTGAKIYFLTIYLLVVGSYFVLQNVGYV